MSGIISDNVGRASGLVKAPAGGLWVELANVNDTVTQAYLDLTDVFSSTYDTYKLFVVGYNSDANDERFAMQWLSASGSGTVQTTSEYDSTTVMGHVDSVGSTSVVARGAYQSTQMLVGNNTTTAGVWKGHYDITIYDAYTTGHYRSVTWNAHTNENNQNKQRIGAGGCMYKNHTASTGIRLKTESGGSSSFSAEKVQLIGLKTS